MLIIIKLKLHVKKYIKNKNIKNQIGMNKIYNKVIPIYIHYIKKKVIIAELTERTVKMVLERKKKSKTKKIEKKRSSSWKTVRSPCASNKPAQHTI